MDATSLTIIFFPFKMNRSIREYIPADAILQQLINENDEKIKFYIVDEKTKVSNTSINSNIIYFSNSIDQWDGIFDLNQNKTNTDIRHPIENISGNVIVFCISEKDCDTYSIMEEFPTQRYQDCIYTQWNFNDGEKTLNEYIKNWSIKNENKVSSPRSQPKQIKSHYELYSGNKIDNENELNTKSIYLHIILLCDYICAYLSFGLLKFYDINNMRQLPLENEPYRELSFFTDEQHNNMVKNSYYFQVEDSILKGFLLYYKICVADGKISPLNVEITIQNLMFNHGQFRRELIISMMKVVANFALNNKFLSSKDFVIEEEKEEEEEQEEVKPNISSKKSGVVSKKFKNVQIVASPKIKKEKISQPNKEYELTKKYKFLI